MGYKYSDPVAWIDEDSKKDVLAAYHDGYMKPLVISDHGIPEKTPVEASVIYPTGSTTEEQKQVVDRAEQRNLKVIQAVIGAQCCVEHYRSQKVIGTEDIFVVTVEVYKEYTAVSLLKAEGSAYYIKDTARIPLRVHVPGNEHRFLYHIAMNVNRIKYKNGINPALHPAMKVVLAGSFWDEMTRVKYMEERLTDCKVFSYKPAHALTLGGCLFLRKYGKRHPVRVFYDEFVYAQCTLPLSHLEALSPERQEEYWRKIRAVSQKDEKLITSASPSNKCSSIERKPSVSLYSFFCVVTTPPSPNTVFVSDSGAFPSPSLNFRKYSDCFSPSLTGQKNAGCAPIAKYIFFSFVFFTFHITLTAVPSSLYPISKWK